VRLSNRFGVVRVAGDLFQRGAEEDGIDGVELLPGPDEHRAQWPDGETGRCRVSGPMMKLASPSAR
jgi:hypothetical protein